MNRKTEAIVGHAPKQPPKIEEIILDEPRPDEAIVEIHAVGICHADVAVLNGTIPLPFPRVLGHEGVCVCVCVCVLAIPFSCPTIAKVGVELTTIAIAKN